MRLVRPAIWTLVWQLCLICLPGVNCVAPSIAKSVQNKQVIIALNYTTWSGYFSNQVNFVAGDALYDSSNTSWTASEDFTIVLGPVNSSSIDRRVVALDRGVNYTSVYENATSGCLSGGVCCSSTSTTLLEANSTIYTAYHMDVPKIYRLFDMNIIVQQAGQLAQSLVFHPWQGSTPDANISAVNATAAISTGGVTDNVALANSQYRLFQANTSDQGFVVNTSYIGNNANQIGVNLSSWESCYQCGSTPGTCTAVQGGSPYDQFSTFRSSSLAGILASAGSNCSWISNSAMTFGSAQYPVQLVACDYPAGLLNVTLQLNASAFGVIPTLPTLFLVNSGQFAWVSGSLTGSIYITIGNSGYQGDWVATGALDCCSNITGTVHCGSSSGISVTATQNVTIGSESSYQYVFNITLSQSTGVTDICTFAVINNGGNTQHTTAVQFIATPAPPPPPAPPLPPASPPPPLAPPPPPSVTASVPASAPSPSNVVAALTFSGTFSSLGSVQLANATFTSSLFSRYMSGLASASGLSLSSVVVTSQQAGSIVLGTALDFPSNTTSYAALATTIYFQTSPNAVFASDSTFASQYGPVVFSNFNSVGLNFTTALLPQSGFAQIEGNVDTPSAAPELLTLGASLSPIEAGDMARIESSSYGTYIPVNGYEPPPPPPTSPPPPPPSPPPPGTNTASTGTATATPTPTPTPTATSSACSFGTPNCGTHGTQTADCSCTCATGWTTYAQQDLANYVYCTIATTSYTSNTSSTNTTSSSSSTSSISSSSSFSTWLSDNIADFSGYLISFVVLTAIAVGISWYCWPERTKKVLRGCCCGSLHGCMWLLNKAGKKAGGKRGRKGDASGSDSDSDSDGGSDQDENGEGKGGKSKGKKGGSKGKHESSDSDDDVDPKFKAKSERNFLYEQEDSDNDSRASQSSEKAKHGKTKGGSSKEKKSKGSSSSKKGKDKNGKKKKKNRYAISDEEEVQGPQLTNIMQIMEQQQRMMQATMQAQYDPLTLTAPQQQQMPYSNMQGAKQRQAQYEPPALMGPPQQQQGAGGDVGSMQRQMLAWQMQQLRPVRQQPLQLAYTSHINPVAQQDGVLEDQEATSPEEAYIAAMRGNPYAAAGFQQQQQLTSGQYAAAAVRQQEARPGSPYLPATAQPLQQQQLGMNGFAYGMTGMRQQGVQQQMQGGPYAAGGLQREQPTQATSGRLGITPMQLAMMQQQRLQQGRANQLVVTPSIHSVTSSNPSWSEEH